MNQPFVLDSEVSCIMHKDYSLAPLWDHIGYWDSPFSTFAEGMWPWDAYYPETEDQYWVTQGPNSLTLEIYEPEEENPCE